MNLRYSLMAALIILVGGCSEETQFNSAAGGKLIEAEVIIPAELPSADASAPGPTTEETTASTPGIDGGSQTIAGTETETGVTGSTVNAAVTTPAADTPAIRTEELKLACASGLKKQLKQSVRFAETKTCNWLKNGNLGRLNLHVQAIEGQKATIALPTNAQLCDLGIGSAATTIQYDDFMVLTLNNQVLLSSNKELLVNVEQNAEQAYAWDFSRVRGKAIDWEAESYCLGNESLCKVPKTDVQGSFQFSISPDSLGKLANNSLDKSKLEFALYSTGDNDDRDCWHTAFTLDFTLTYIE